MSDVFLGSNATITLRVVDVAGAPADPATISLTITLPDNTQVNKTKADFTNPTVGTWRYQYLTTKVGHHAWVATTTTPDGSVGGYFDVTSRVPYTDVDEVRRVLAGSENLTGTAAGLSDSDLAEAISEAQTEVDSRLAGRYTVPFADPPQIVSTVTRDIAAYLATLTQRRGEQIQTAESVALRYQRAEALLGQLASGQAPLSVTDEMEPVGNTVEVRNPYEGDLFGPNDFGLGPLPPGFWPGAPLDRAFRGW